MKVGELVQRLSKLDWDKDVSFNLLDENDCEETLFLSSVSVDIVKDKYELEFVIDELVDVK